MQVPSSTFRYAASVRAFFLDLASNAGTIACSTDSAVMSLIPIHPRTGDSELPLLINRALTEAGWTLNDLTQLACVTGPGGFTSLRVAVAAINALAYAREIPATGIHLSDLYQSRIPNPKSQTPILWLHSTKKTQVFVRDFSSAGEPRCVTLDELDDLLPEKGEWMGELIPEHREVIDRRGLREAKLRELSEILPAFLMQQEYTKKTLEPWYGRGW